MNKSPLLQIVNLEMTGFLLAQQFDFAAYAVKNNKSKL